LTTPTTAAAELVDAAHALSRLGLVTAFGHVSARRGNSMLITPAADLATVTESTLVEVPLALADDPRESSESTQAVLPTGAPAETWVHLALYRARADAAAVVRAQPASATAASATATVLLPLHGQAAWLGESVPVYGSAHLLRSAERGRRAADALPTGEALLLRGNGAITVGSSPGVALARMWVLSAACDAWLACRDAAEVTFLTSDEIVSWRATADELLPRLWQHLRGAGPE
jgi:HCOMODA/2-hydroxy-3-carboxy-muconic semialdehyde decarboxylase